MRRPISSVRRPPILRAVVLALVAALGLSACDFDVYKLPLPGGADVGDDPITVTAEFRDVLDLVPQSTVKVDEVDVGRITDIDLKGYTAVVTMTVRNDTSLPANPVATIRQTSLLGEKFVSLAPPESGASSEPLADGADIPLERTGRNPEVEEVLGALSLILNGGGIAQARTISRELNATLQGREQSVRSVLGQLDDFVGQLDDQKQTIVTAIDKVNNLSVGIRRQQGSINNALEQLPSALASLDRQRDDLVEMLGALQRLSDVGVRVINRTEESTIETVRQLQPLLTNLADSGDALVDSFNVLLTFPFVDEVVGRDPQVARDLRVGDYTNLNIELDLSLDVLCTGLNTITSLIEQNAPIEQILAALDRLPDACDALVETLTGCLSQVTGGQTPDLAECARVLGDLLPTLCETGLGGTPLEALCPDEDDPDLPVPTDPVPADPTVPALPELPQLGGDSGGAPGSGSGGAGAGAADGGLPGLGGLSSGLNTGLPGLLNRPAPGAGSAGPDGAVTLGRMMTVYDPALVSLLTPGMVLR